MTEEKKDAKKTEIIKEETKTGEPPREIPLQKLVWKEVPEPIIHVVRGHVIKIDSQFLYFQGERKDAPLIIPVDNVKEVK